MSQITKGQGIALVGALFDESIAGVDHDGNTYGNEKNAHFLACLRVLFPDLPTYYQVAKWVEIPEGAHPTHYGHESNKKTQVHMNRLCAILREVADAVEHHAEVPF